jgi:GNAT superfamily N-acetyltransferase
MSEITLAEEPADGEAVRWCFERYYAELDGRFEGGFAISSSLPLEPGELTPPRGLVLVARLEGAPVGCGTLKLRDPWAAEIKRLWVSDAVRGQGLGSRLLAELEARALAAGRTRARLDTNRSLSEAIALYRRRGYREVGPFNAEPYADLWFEKDLLVEAHR